MGRRSDHKPDELRRIALEAAKTIVSSEGLAALSIRKIANKIGYTSGTLYQHFRNMDDLIEQLNAGTIDALRMRCERVEFGNNPAASLKALTDVYAEFTTENKNLWDAIFEHRLPKGYQRNEVYVKNVRELVAVVEEAIAQYYPEGQEALRLHHARVLWTWLYGISSLMAASRISPDESYDALINSVIGMYVGSRNFPESD